MAVKISVIVPVYNMEQYLKACLDSILGQTLVDIEVIAINDGSTDNSLVILQEYACKDKRIKIIDKCNEGVGTARNDGIRKAIGKYVAFMDSDDYYPNSSVLEKLYNAACENNVKIAGGHKVYANSNGSIEEEICPYVQAGVEFSANGLTPYKMFQYDYGYTQYIYDREMLIQGECFFPSYKRFQDPPFFVKAMIFAEQFYAIDEVVYCYRMLPSKSKYTLEKTVDFLKGVIDNLEISKNQNLSKLHYISAHRLNTEGSFMATRNLYDEKSAILLAWLIKANAAVDASWLRDEGFDIEEPFVLDVFKYVVETSRKYEVLRNNRVVRQLKKMLRR